MHKKKRRLTPRQIRTIRRWAANGKKSQYGMAEHFGVSRSLIYDIVHGKVYADVK